MTQQQTRRVSPPLRGGGTPTRGCLLLTEIESQPGAGGDWEGVAGSLSLSISLSLELLTTATAHGQSSRARVGGSVAVVSSKQPGVGAPPPLRGWLW